MKNLLLNSLLSVSLVLPSYLISSSNARADDWGCQVILCLSNPGGPTQYAECRPPIQKLWRALAKGHSFPTCSGVGFHSSRPGYEPYYCDDGFRLTGSFGLRGQQATCVFTQLQKVERSLCSFGRANDDGASGPVLSARWQRQDGHLQCMAYPIMRPKVRSQPHYIDVTIEGVGEQRVWY
ncbi:hypothetical protein [Agrobacterium tumefaciens]|uniref:hypothetical protein n=1 Tax=Agrobacterium tumefaciens TaxID=358 RepID=UPI000DD8A17F|nr:hypothetical protein [Agrobacterium tumefaciens]AYM09100.1 hypothetical protein At1D1460_48590 [Agrobacterium tumefaciens]NSZ35582.1 hypothetical protein [Agrobacterium tumefaciens]QLG25642.1 hypothetical protein EML4_25275 [Agrobacterium tumefaciens]UXS89380.1 hypothetical protein FY144_24425 [Agrobacterium tumefaciens]